MEEPEGKQNDGMVKHEPSHWTLGGGSAPTDWLTRRRGTIVFRLLALMLAAPGLLLVHVGQVIGH